MSEVPVPYDDGWIAAGSNQGKSRQGASRYVTSSLCCSLDLFELLAARIFAPARGSELQLIAVIPTFFPIERDNNVTAVCRSPSNSFVKTSHRGTFPSFGFLERLAGHS
jgi:hypothetical protein